MLRDLKELLYTGGYYPEEIDRILDPENPSFIDFDPVLGYILRDYDFHDGMDGILNSYVYHKHGGHRLMINYADQPCRLNTYGDSFTQCAQVNNGETWQETLATHFHEPIRNFGVGGYGVYQAYRRLLRTEVIDDLAAEYLILNIWDDDYMRNLDAARWIRVAWMCRDLPRGGKDTYPVHGFPWAHLRYHVDEGKWVEHDGMCEKPEDLRKLVGKENFYNAFKDDHVAHLYCLREGGDAPIDYLEKLAEAFGVKVDLRTSDREKRCKEAFRLHHVYGMRSTQWICENLNDWCAKNGRKLMILVSYDVPTVQEYVTKGTRFDQDFVDWLEGSGLLYVDTLKKMKTEHDAWKLSLDEFIANYYIGRAGAQVFGHYNPHGNFWFAHAIRQELVDWLDPKPPSYR